MSKLLLILIISLAHAAKPASEPNPRLGEHWNKTPAADSQLARSVFEINFFLGHGTATYLGTYDNRDLFLTVNHMVGSACKGLTVRNKLVSAEISWRCEEVLFQQSDIDTAIISVTSDDPKAIELLRTVSPARLSSVPLPLRGELTMLGYGSFANPNHSLHEEAGLTCVMLAPYEPKLIQDPDTETTSPSPIWSMPVGCEASPGDSGAPVFNRGRNLINGIVWTGGRHASDLTNTNLIRVFEKSPERLWTDFTYIVPAQLILDRISSHIGNREIRCADRRALKELLMARHLGD